MNNNDFYGCDRCTYSCWAIIPAVLVALLTLTVGVILGAVLSETFLAALAAIITLAVVFFVAVVIWALVRICRCRRG